MSAKKNILFIHQSFPGQFGYLAPVLAKDGHQVVALTLNQAPQIPGVKILPYKLSRKPLQGLPYLMQEQDAKMLRAEGVARICEDLRIKGFIPDVIYAHPGWGECLFIKTIWPSARLVVYGEWYYNLNGQEVDFDPEFEPLGLEDRQRLKLKNSAWLHALSDADAVISPTKWQKSRFPQWAAEKIQVVHDGLNMAVLKPNHQQKLKLGKGIELDAGKTILTFAARYMEPVRGFHKFMRALPAIQKSRPDVQVLIMGRDAGDSSSGYGRPNPQGRTWRQSLLDELKGQLNLKSIHFLGFQNHQTYLAALQISTCHVYLTSPFVLSWSFLEAAALGVPMVASRTDPVMEFEGISNLTLCDFHQVGEISEAVLNVLASRPAHTPNALPEINLLRTLQQQKEILVGREDAVSQPAGMVVEKKPEPATADGIRQPGGKIKRIPAVRRARPRSRA
ncbi:MAG: glycosyltransferase [Desulfovibrionales bacterium]|nr:MAG: glycosyltransferase [Desulfovibrionales bacterium]